MAINIFRKNDPSTLKWHPELMEGEGKDNFFEYIWFDGMYKGDDGQDYYLRISPSFVSPPGNYGINEPGIPAFSYDLVMPDGKVYDHVEPFKPEEFKEAAFGGSFGDRAQFTGTLDDDSYVKDVMVKFNIKDLACDLKVTPLTKSGVQFVPADHGYSYFHPVKKRAMGWWPLIPQSQVDGTITVEGKTIHISGSGYMDKQVSNKEETYGGTGQAWWTWGHFWAGPYTATFTDSAATAHYKYRHFAPFILWKNGEIVVATYNFQTVVEQYSIDKVTGKFYPSVLSQKAIDGSVEVYTQITNGVVTEVEVTSLEEMKYVRQLADVNMEIYRFGGFAEEVKGRICIEYGSGAHYMPWDKIDAK